MKLKEFIQRWKAPDSKAFKPIMARINWICSTVSGVVIASKVIPNEYLIDSFISISNYIITGCISVMIGCNVIFKLTVDWNTVDLEKIPDVKIPNLPSTE